MLYQLFNSFVVLVPRPNALLKHFLQHFFSSLFILAFNAILHQPLFLHHPIFSLWIGLPGLLIIILSLPPFICLLAVFSSVFEDGSKRQLLFCFPFAQRPADTPKNQNYHWVCTLLASIHSTGKTPQNNLYTITQ